MPKGSTSFKPGQSGNLKGRPPKGYSITEMMKSMLKSNPEAKREIGVKVMEKAMLGDLNAVKLLWSYMDGTPVGTLELTGKDGKPLEIEARAIYTPLQLKIISEGYSNSLKKALEIKSGK